MKINDEGTSNAAHWHERAMKAEARLAEAQRQNKRLRYALQSIADEVYDPWTHGAEAQRIALSALSTNAPEVSSELVVTVSAGDAT